MPSASEISTARKKLRDAEKKLRDQRKRLDAAAGGTAYDAKKADMLEASREQSATGREVGPLPEVVDPRRKNRGLDDAEFFHKTYFPNRFYLEFGAPHLAAIEALRRSTEEGGLKALAMGRGFGKTSLTECEVIRALVYGLRRYIVFVGATDSLAGRAIKRIFREFETNDLLLEDFPEVCHPIRCLERITQRARGQTLNDQPTMMEITDGHLVLPRVSGAASSGAVIQSFGLTGALKGLNVLAPDGTPIRPDLVVIDDAQTRESSKSPTQTEDRERIICDDVLGLAGPRTKMAAVFLCTPIYPNDLTERFIDRDRHPEWQGTRTKMVEQMPTRMDLWDEYSEVRRESLRSGDHGERGNAWYAERQADMDAGCVLAWPDKVIDGDVSAVQSAMNLYYTNPVGFRSEYQCEPLAAQLGAGAKELVPASVCERTNGAERYAVPPGCTRLTAGIDIGGELVWWVVCGWNERFGGGVVDYGCWPKQARGVFAASDPRPGLSAIYPGMTEPQRVFAAVNDLLPAVAGRAYLGAGGQEYRVERCLIDAGWQPDAVYQAVARSPLAGVVYASKGVGRSTTQVGVARWKPRPGERSGHHWRLTAGDRGRRQVQFDPDAWKTYLHGALVTPPGGPTGLTLWGKSSSAHELFGEHCGAEYSEPATLKGDTFDKWQVRPDRRDNHLWDALVLAACAASVQGLTWQASGEAVVKAEPRRPAPPPPPGERKRIVPVRRG